MALNLDMTFVCGADTSKSQVVGSTGVVSPACTVWPPCVATGEYQHVSEAAKGTYNTTGRCVGNAQFSTLKMMEPTLYGSALQDPLRLCGRRLLTHHSAVGAVHGSPGRYCQSSMRCIFPESLNIALCLGMEPGSLTSKVQALADSALTQTFPDWSVGEVVTLPAPISEHF